MIHTNFGDLSDDILLRQKAEEIYLKGTIVVATAAGLVRPEESLGADRQRGVYQIELELQNEELRASRSALEASRQRYLNLYDFAPVGYFSVNSEGVILRGNLKAASLLGLPRIGLLKRSFSSFIFNEDLHQYNQLHSQLLATNKPQDCELRMLDGYGCPFWVNLATSCADSEDGLAVLRIVVIDITAIKEHQSHLEHIAHFDDLTKLPNRLLLADRLNQAMAQAERRNQQVAVAYLDLDGFKATNDRYGHDVGDQLLIQLATTMKDTLREGDTLARLGGDEFVAVLVDLEGIEGCKPLLKRLLEAAVAPVDLGGLVLQVSASIGVSFYPQAHAIEADQLLRQADQAMYQAKLAGRNRYHFFDAVHDSSLRFHHESLERISLAMTNGEFVLHYQPKVNMHSGQVIGAEALIRWQHPVKGLLAPAAFLPVIEDHQLAVDLGEWVIDTVLTQVESWRATGLDLPVSVNVGARQLQQGDFVACLQAIMARHPTVGPSSLELELLETSALIDIGQVSKVIENCQKMGVKFALDDFGTGYSSLTYLKRLHVTLLKIDQSFVRDMLDDPDDLAILRGVIGLAASFNCEVIAEGVETVAHGTALMGLGCKLAQGYGIARPMPAELLPVWATTWKPDVAWSGVPSAGKAARSIFCIRG
jgi:diguanylate cyclase (GGDEF)-like protein/PAS domain S-box-containing protein